MSPWLRLRWPRHTDAECGLPPPHPNPDFRAKSKPRWEESSPCGRDTHRADYVSFILIGLLAIVLSRLWAGPLGFVNPALGLRRRVENVECEGVYGRGTRAQGKVKQIVGSTLKDLNPSGASDDEPVTNFVSEKSPGDFARMYQTDGLTGGHVIMLSADDDTKEAAFEALRAYPGGLQVGGGIRTDNAMQFLDAGASHVIVTSYVFRDGQLDRQRLKELVGLVGPKRLVLDLSCRKQDGVYKVVTDRWQVFSDFVLTRESLAELAQSADELLVHGVDVEGMKLGIDEELVALLGDISPLPCTYAGGARTLQDLEVVRRAGRNMVDVTIGSALDCFGGDLPYDDVVAWHQSNGR